MLSSALWELGLRSPKRYQAVPEGSMWSRVVPVGSTRSQAVPKGTKWSRPLWELGPRGPRRSEEFLSAHQWFRKIPIGYEHHKLPIGKY